ncbi:MAG: NAD(P)H-dependent glycerol-3-phosphate dehydrogenase [Actinomycetes bacterium]
MKSTVLGTGAWGTTLAQIIIDAGHEVLLWGRNSSVVDEINTLHTNEKFLPGIKLPEQVRATTDLKAALEFSDVIIVAIPAQTLRENLKAWAPHLKPGMRLISTLKGIEADTHSRMTEIMASELGISLDDMGLLTGPNLAGELSLRQPAGAVAASTNPKIVDELIELFTNPYFRVYPSSDLVGCELAGATKSVIALAVGMAIGLGYGENTQSMIITRGLGEVARFGIGYGADPLTNLGLAGMGDLVASCGSALSRNRTFGEALGRTGSMSEASILMPKTVEGVASARSIRELAHRVGVEVPIIEVVSDVVSGAMTPADAMEHLKTVSLRAELA